MARGSAGEKMKRFFWWLRRLLRPHGCRKCGYSNLHDFTFHDCKEEDRVAYWRHCKAFQLPASLDCEHCHGRGQVQIVDNPYMWKACQCVVKVAETLEPPSRLEDTGCVGWDFLCESCWQESTPEERWEWFLKSYAPSKKYDKDKRLYDGAREKLLAGNG